MNLFFGDSITAGEGCPASFVPYLGGPLQNYNLGVSGATIGEYSIYPVDGNSLLSLIPQNKMSIERANNIFIEYGINDISAVLCGNATIRQVIIAWVKAFNLIKNINPNVNIYFLSYGTHLVIKDLAECVCTYLNDTYFRDVLHIIFADDFVHYYTLFEESIMRYCKVIHLFDYREYNDINLVQADGIHPTHEGHKYIADCIKKYI